jgi:hypothetical protein
MVEVFYGTSVPEQQRDEKTEGSHPDLYVRSSRILRRYADSRLLGTTNQTIRRAIQRSWLRWTRKGGPSAYTVSSVPSS